MFLDILTIENSTSDAKIAGQSIRFAFTEGGGLFAPAISFQLYFLLHQNHPLRLLEFSGGESVEIYAAGKP